MSPMLAHAEDPRHSARPVWGADLDLAVHVLDGLSAHAALLDDEGRVLAVNRAWRSFQRANGGSDERCGVGRSYLAVCEQAQGEEAVIARAAAVGLRRLLDGAESEFRLEYPCHAPHEERWFALRGTRLPGPGPARVLVAHESVTGRVRADRDAAERREVEQELRSAKERAEAANRSKTEFVSGMSHELRTPLNSVIGFTSMLRKNKMGNLREQDLLFLERIQANGMHLLGLINDVLDLSKIEAGKMEVARAPVALDALVRETLEELQGSVPPGVELRLELPEPLAPLETDPRRLKQILINLVGNALKFTEAGSVTVAVAAEPQTRRPTGIRIVDTGLGIAPERLGAIFEVFEQGEGGASRRFRGTGLGLPISASLARLLGFRIEVSSEPGWGSTFALSLDGGE